jgi:hypothetical protein
VEAGLIVAARRSAAPEDDDGIDAAQDAGHLDARSPPPEWDLREPWHKIARQGRTNSCVGWALADSVLRYQLVKAGRLQPDEPLSARYVWMGSKETDKRIDYPSTFLEEDGTSLKAALELVRRFGIVLDSELPWEKGLAPGTPKAFYESAAARRITRYYNLGDDSVDRRECFDGWRRWMHQRGPVLVLVALDGQLGTPRATAFNGPAQHSHAAALFAYGPDHFLVRSSWGTDWGEAGYAEIGLDYAAEAVIESYGVVI